MKENTYPAIVFSIIFALLVWISVNLTNEFQVVLSVPFLVENIPPTKALANPLPTTLSVKVHGTGWQILNSMLSPNLRYVLDVESVVPQKVFSPLQDYGERLNIAHGLRVLEIQPESIKIILDEKLKKSVPLIPVLNATYRDGFDIVGSITVTPPEVAVSGAQSLLTKIDSWKTKTIVLHDLKSPVRVSVSVLDTLSREIEVSPATATMEFDVQSIAEKRINGIPVRINQVPINRHVVLIPPTIDIIVRSGVRNIAAVADSDFYAYIDYSSILLDTSGILQPTLFAPENIRIVRQIPSSLQYVVRK